MSTEFLHETDRRSYKLYKAKYGPLIKIKRVHAGDQEYGCQAEGGPLSWPASKENEGLNPSYPGKEISMMEGTTELTENGSSWFRGKKKSSRQPQFAWEMTGSLLFSFFREAMGPL